MAATLTKTDDRRARTRTEINRPAVLRFGDTVAEVTITDLTRHGCRIVAAADLPPFAHVSIGLAGVGQTPAQLIWRSERQYGCAFTQPLPQGAVTAAAASNVAYLGTTAGPIEGASASAAQPTDKFDMRARLAVMAGLSGLLWGIVIGAGALLI